jgi:non-ribosomal peptide synthetase component F
VRDVRGEATYADLDNASRQVSTFLFSGGLGRGRVVAIYADRSRDLACALLGVLRAGGAFLILDPSYPPARVVEFLRQAQPGAFIELEGAGSPGSMVETYLRSIEDILRLRLPLEGSGREIMKGSAQDASVGPDDLAYLAFTSGSTGVPKAVLGRHGPLTYFLPWLAEAFELGAGDRFSLLSALSHDPLHRDVFTPLCLGGSVCCPPVADAGTYRGMRGWMARSGITVAHLTPAMGERLMQSVGDERCPDTSPCRWNSEYSPACEGNQLLRGD